MLTHHVIEVKDASDIEIAQALMKAGIVARVGIGTRPNPAAYDPQWIFSVEYPDNLLTIKDLR